MADSDIDYFEVDEHGKHFLAAAGKLKGASDIVNVGAVKKRITEALALVGVEREKAGLRRGDGSAGVVTEGLVAAHSRFLHLYNGVAKKAIGAVLTDIGRPDDMKLFFKDMLPKEAPAPVTDAAVATADAPPAEPAAPPAPAKKPKRTRKPKKQS